tara:strand:+ start:73 stop:555 length:483 start_codon:yes stop_codon:yes gene_type:complete
MRKTARMQAPSTNDRRKFRRFPAAQLQVSWRIRKGFFTPYALAQSEDFTREGVSILVKRQATGDSALSKGTRVELRLVLEMATGDLVVERLVARVQNQRSIGDATLYGLMFDFAANRYMRSEHTKAQLGRIEGILDRTEKLRLRVQPLNAIPAFARNDQS